jgi:dTDP-4-amino-4,6-dideoxygalactose transaminase
LYKKNWVKALSNCKVEKVKGLKICKSKSSQILNLSITDYIKILNAEGVDVRQTVTPPLHKTYLFKNIKQVYKIFPSFALNKIEDYPKYKKNDMPNSNYYYKYHLSFPTFSFENQKELIEQYLEAIIKIENILLETI